MKRIIGMGLALSIIFSALVMPMLSRSYTDNSITITKEDVPL